MFAQPQTTLTFIRDVVVLARAEVHRIVKDFGNNSYHIELPDSLKPERGIHNVFLIPPLPHHPIPPPRPAPPQYQHLPPTPRSVHPTPPSQLPQVPRLPTPTPCSSSSQRRECKVAIHFHHDRRLQAQFRIPTTTCAR